MTNANSNQDMPQDPQDGEIPNWSPWLRHCRGDHGRIIGAAEKRAAWEAAAARHRAITAEYGGQS